MNRNTRVNRREFLQSGAAAAAVAIGGTQGIKAEQGKKEQKIDPAKIVNFHPGMRYRRVGDTDAVLSVISCGGIGFERAVAHRAVDLGVNLIHTSPGYDGGRSFQEVASVLKTKRDKVYVAVKDTFYKGSLSDIDTVLKALGTDRIDFVMFNRHHAGSVADPAIPERFAAWKKQGKVRYAGLTSHDDVKGCVAAGIGSGYYSLIMPVLNQPELELMAEELRNAREKGIGIMAMKSLQGLNGTDLQTAYVKKLLANPAVTTINKAFTNHDLFTMFYKAVGDTLSAEEDMRLYRYARENRRNTCLMCGSCERACPKGIGISTLLRAKLYYHDQLRDRETAAAAARDLPADRRHDGVCLSCRTCESVCPNGIAIVDRLREASNLFRTLPV